MFIEGNDLNDKVFFYKLMNMYNIKLIEVIKFLLIITLVGLALLWFNKLLSSYKYIRRKFISLMILFTIFLSLYLLIIFFNIPVSGEVSKYLDLIFITVISILIIKIASIMIFDFVFKEKRKVIVPHLLRSFINLVVYLTILFLIFHYILGFELTPILATSAVVTLILGLALQETLGNFFSGLAMHFDPPFQIGDWVKIGDTICKIQEIKWRSVKVVNRHLDTVIFPNSYIAKETVINFSKPLQSHGHSFTIGVSYWNSPNHVISVIKDLLKDVNGVDTSIEPLIRLVEYQDFAILYNIRFFYYDYAKIEQVESEIKSRLWYVFNREGIIIPFPIRNIYIQKEEKNIEQEQREKIETLKKIFLFSEMNQEEISLISTKLKKKIFTTGEIIVKQSDEGGSMFIIKKGNVSINLATPPEQMIQLKMLHQGDFFGEISLLTGDKRTATVKAITEVELYELAREELHSVIQRNKDIAYKLEQVVMQRKEELLKAIEDDTLVMEEKAKNEKSFHIILDKVKKFLFS